MTTRAELRDRLASATPRDTLPGVGSGLADTELRPAERLRIDLTEPTIIQPQRGLSFLELSTGPQLADDVITLIGAQPAIHDVAINVFPRTIGPEVQGFQAAFLETAFLATAVLVSSGHPLEDLIDDIIRLSASAMPAGRALREMFSDLTRQPPPVDPPRGSLPGLAGLPEGLLTTAETLSRKGCVGSVKVALTRWGSAMSQATPSYLRDVIDFLDPPDNCPGEQMTIQGHGLGDGTRSTVAFTRRGGGVILTPATSIIEWTNDYIRFVIPDGAVRGPVGILVYPPSDGSFAAAASDAIAEIGTCFGPEVVMQLEQVLGRVSGPPISAPTTQGNRANLFSGGPPIIEWFEMTPSGPLWPGRTIRLSWSIIGADSIEIVAQNVSGSPPHELPTISGPLPYASGSVSITVPGTHPWRGQYVLRARNRCTRTGATEQAIDLEMVVRKGLALGGGGTRGDFQVGALVYLYDEKGFRPDAIASTSVGSINAIELVMGDDPATPTTSARSAATRLAVTWLSFTDESMMWGEEPWLTRAKASVRNTLRSLSWQGLTALPYSVVAGLINVNELSDLFENPREKGIVAVFNLGPIKTRAQAIYSQTRTDASGIKLRLVAISLETGEFVMVDETGGVRQRGPQPLSPPTAAPTTDVIDGAIASATMPGIFPAQRLANHMCVDGGVKEVVPVQVAVRDLGCNEVYAIRCSARPALQEMDPGRTVGEVLARSVLDMTFDAIADDDVAPFGGWPDGVAVTVIHPSFNLHDPLVVEAGLIRIAMDYGWMRAGDVLDVPEGSRTYAMKLSDEITRLRVQNWREAHWAAGVPFQDPHRSFTDFVFAGATAGQSSEIQTVPTPESVNVVRANCRRIRAALEQRLLINAPTPVLAIRTGWFTQWESIRGAMPTTDPWVAYSGVTTWPADTPPPPI